jgi:hypothetical protein
MILRVIRGQRGEARRRSSQALECVQAVAVQLLRRPKTAAHFEGKQISKRIGTKSSIYWFYAYLSSSVATYRRKGS